MGIVMGENVNKITIGNLTFENPQIISLYGILPDEFSEVHGTKYDSIEIKSRSNPLASYGGSTARTIDFTFDIHEDYLDEFEGGNMKANITDYVNKIKSITYPRYVETYVVPPRVYIKVADSFRLKGYCNNCNVVWKKPFRDGRYIYATIILSIVETLSISFTADEIFSHQDLARYTMYQG